MSKEEWVMGLVLVAGIILLGYWLYQHNLLRAFIGQVKQDQQLRATLEQQFQRLDPQQQRFIRTLIALADPITALTPSEMDDEVVAWLQAIVDRRSEPTGRPQPK